MSSSGCRHAGTKTLKVERLVRKGVPTGMIVRRLRLSKQYVYGMKKRLDAAP